MLRREIYQSPWHNRAVHTCTHSRVVEVVRNEGGALEEAKDVSWQRALEAAPVNPGGILFGQESKQTEEMEAFQRFKRTP